MLSSVGIGGAGVGGKRSCLGGACRNGFGGVGSQLMSNGRREVLIGLTPSRMRDLRVTRLHLHQI
jgi:hypothetical protein